VGGSCDCPDTPGYQLRSKERETEGELELEIRNEQTGAPRSFNTRGDQRLFVRGAPLAELSWGAKTSRSVGTVSLWNLRVDPGHGLLTGG
jgi:hypothetical protein